MNNKIYFPLHIDSGNRGCEAICLGTIKILNLDSNRYVGLCKDIDNDKRLLNKADLIKGFNVDTASIWKKIFLKVCRKLLPNKIYSEYYYRRVYGDFLIQSGDISFITGGDKL